jgi:two-component system copper resistance phosphate regulon response regulator CusR
VLENAGYQVMEAMNGQEALHQILHLKQSVHPIDLLILDIEMSGRTGWQILDELKRFQISIPTILITGLINEQMLQRIRDNCCLEYLKKPFDPEHVTTCVSRVLQKTQEEPYQDVYYPQYKHKKLIR